MNLEIVKTMPASDTRGPPVLFVHGMWHAAWCWQVYFLPYFAEHGYCAYALSLRGHGESEGRERLRWCSLADYVADLDHVVHHMDQPPVLIGHSMGGLVVQKYLTENKVPAVVLLASVPPEGAFGITARVARRHPFTVIKSLLMFRLLSVVGTKQLAREALFSADMPQEQLEAYFSRLQDESVRVFLDMLVPRLTRPRQTGVPLLVLGASDDAFITTEEVVATARAYGVEAQFITGMAHNMMLEAGWRIVADRILHWLGEQAFSRTGNASKNNFLPVSLSSCCYTDRNPTT